VVPFVREPIHRVNVWEGVSLHALHGSIQRTHQSRFTKTVRVISKLHALDENHASVIASEMTQSVSNVLPNKRLSQTDQLIAVIEA
jgi:hypothetical protein